MANRAYLYFTEVINPIRCDRNKIRYYDSRHNIPFSWWFFFDTQSLVIKPESYNGSKWYEPWLARSLGNAKKQFKENIQRIVTLTQHKITINDLNEFIDNLSTFSDKYLQLDRNEIFQAEDDEDLKKLQTILNAVEKHVDISINSTQLIDSYTGILKLKGNDNFVNIIGCTY